MIHRDRADNLSTRSARLSTLFSFKLGLSSIATPDALFTVVLDHGLVMVASYLPFGAGS